MHRSHCGPLPSSECSFAQEKFKWLRAMLSHVIDQGFSVMAGLVPAIHVFLADDL
jgi:hypothetical protein